MSAGSSVGSHNRAKTVCPQGHPYSDANTYVDRRGSRRCKACRPVHQVRHLINKLGAAVVTEILREKQGEQQEMKEGQR